MKKICLNIVLAIPTLLMAQQKTTGVVPLINAMTAKIDMDQPTSTVTLTLTGPSNRFFALGFNATQMSANTDCVVMTSATILSDMKLPGGHFAPAADAVNNWTIQSNTTSGTTRTVIATRPFVAETSDFTFTYAMTSINLIFSHRNTSGYTLNGHGDNFGNLNAPFTNVLGGEDFNLLSSVTISPNPSTGIFMISKNERTPISALNVYDINAKLVKSLSYQENQSVDLTGLNPGLYFLEISNESDKTVRKILIE
ncbi:T9SS type A sorting domain-containing protein [Flavobacterium silvaticum]|uniref:T9SS type A sorting domain-containing protein n=1 Tax=Flavobacterium silvaticum TaxID=1852020 RepID=A0A972FWP7_9FLAO|nr:T9SS type A sorting domain-containing protein [Flavobacterium silvaticum]NMH29407.1 T9SS type A sorting domain-containing protein [Flavobacterium silvaticum]